MGYLDEFFDYYCYSGRLTESFANRIHYYFGVSHSYLKPGKIPKEKLKEIILEHNKPSEIEIAVLNETRALLNGNF